MCNGSIPQAHCNHPDVIVLQDNSEVDEYVTEQQNNCPTDNVSPHHLQAGLEISKTGKQDVVKADESIVTNRWTHKPRSRETQYYQNWPDLFIYHSSFI